MTVICLPRFTDHYSNSSDSTDYSDFVFSEEVQGFESCDSSGSPFEQINSSDDEDFRGQDHSDIKEFLDQSDHLDH